MRPLLFLLLAGLAVAGCDSTDIGEFSEKVVVSGTLIAGEPLGSVELGLSRPIGDVFDSGEARVEDGVVTVSLLDANGAVEESTAYEYVGGQNPLYLPVGDNLPLVLPGRTYRLDVVVPGTPERRLTAQTTVPEALDLVEPPPDRIPYLAGQGPSLRLSESTAQPRRAVFLFSVRALEPLQFQRVAVEGETRYRSVPETGFPLVPSRFVFGDCVVEGTESIVCEQDPHEFTQGSSPLLNQESYENLGDGTLRVNVPWLAFGYYGPAELSLASVDDAIVDFFETQAVQFAPTTLSPGEIPNIVSNVEGGLGFFGSIAQVRTTIFIEAGAESPF